MPIYLRHEYCDECDWDRGPMPARRIRPPTWPIVWHLKHKKDRGLSCPECEEPLCDCIWCKLAIWRRGTISHDNRDKRYTRYK